MVKSEVCRQCIVKVKHSLCPDSCLGMIRGHMHCDSGYLHIKFKVNDPIQTHLQTHEPIIYPSSPSKTPVCSLTITHTHPTPDGLLAFLSSHARPINNVWMDGRVRWPKGETSRHGAHRRGLELSYWMTNGPLDRSRELLLTCITGQERCQC